MVEKKWYAVYTMPRTEKKVAERLSKNGIENYCPLNKVQRQWADRKKILWEPLFTSYVFVRISEAEQLAIKKTDGVINLVYWLGKPAVIREAEIIIIRQFLNEYETVRLEKTVVNIHDTVRVISGPFLEQEGLVMAVKNKVAKIILPSLGYMMTADIETARVEVVYDRLVPFNKKSGTTAFGK